MVRLGNAEWQVKIYTARGHRTDVERGRGRVVLDCGENLAAFRHKNDFLNRLSTGGHLGLETCIYVVCRPFGINVLDL